MTHSNRGNVHQWPLCHVLNCGLSTTQWSPDVPGSKVQAGEWNCTIWISLSWIRIYSERITPLCGTIPTYACWIRSRPLISDNEPTFYTGCHRIKLLLLFRLTGIWPTDVLWNKEDGGRTAVNSMSAYWCGLFSFVLHFKKYSQAWF